MSIRASSLLLCHHVYEDIDSHNVTLLGIFAGLKATKFPTAFRAFSVYTLLVGDPGESDEFRFHCFDRITGEVLVEERRRVILGMNGKRHMHVRVEDVRFPRPGEYAVALSADGEVIGEQMFVVTEKGS